MDVRSVFTKLNSAHIVGQNSGYLLVGSGCSAEENSAATGKYILNQLTVKFCPLCGMKPPRCSGTEAPLFRYNLARSAFICFTCLSDILSSIVFVCSMWQFGTAKRTKSKSLYFAAMSWEIQTNFVVFHIFPFYFYKNSYHSVWEKIHLALIHYFL